MIISFSRKTKEGLKEIVFKNSNKFATYRYKPHLKLNKDIIENVFQILNHTLIYEPTNSPDLYDVLCYMLYKWNTASVNINDHQ